MSIEKETFEIRRNAKRFPTKLHLLPVVAQGFENRFGIVETAALLQRRAEARNPLRAVDVCRAVADTALALAHLHAQSPPIAHRDVKPENILLGADGRFKLCDFGSATAETFSYTVYETSNADVGVEEERVHRYCTPQYRAPELCDVRCGERLDERVDLWALGCLSFELLTGYTPFTGESVEEVFENILEHTRGDAVRWPEEEEHLSEQAFNLVTRLLEPVQEHRLGAAGGSTPPCCACGSAPASARGSRS